MVALIRQLQALLKMATGPKPSDMQLMREALKPTGDRQAPATVQPSAGQNSEH